MKHQTPSEFHTRPVYIELVGAGATGSLILAGLVRLHMAIKELGHPYGMAVRCWDPDTVSAANIGRQLFSEQEIGQNKAVTLISRYNYHFGLEWFAEPEKFSPTKNYESGNVVVISAVDTRKSRASINAGLKQYYNAYLIDSGCGKDFGQVCIGNGSKELPYPWVIHPELLDEKLDSPRQYQLFHGRFSGTPRIIYQPVCRHRSIGNTLAALPVRRSGLFRTLFQSQNRQNDAENYY